MQQEQAAELQGSPELWAQSRLRLHAPTGSPGHPRQHSQPSTAGTRPLPCSTCEPWQLQACSAGRFASCWQLLSESQRFGGMAQNASPREQLAGERLLLRD